MNVMKANTKELINPADYAIGMAYTVKQAAFIPYIMGTPLFGPDYPIEAEGGYSTDINFNLAFLPGSTSAKIAFRLKPNPEVSLPSEVRFRFFYWPVDTVPLESFGDEYEYATDITFRFAIREDGSEYIKVTEDIQGMPYMMASKMRILSDTLQPREWNEIELALDTAFDFPERAWPNGVLLENNQATGEAVAREFRKLHAVFQSGYDKTFDIYEPRLTNSGLSYGMSAKEWFDESAISELAKGEIELLPYDDSSSELRIYGNGRLATLSPPPISGKAEFDQILTPYIYFWKDQRGIWRPWD